MVGDDWNAARTDLAHEGKVATLKLLFCQIAVLPGNGRMRFDACCIRNDNGAVDQNPKLVTENHFARSHRMLTSLPPCSNLFNLLPVFSNQSINY